MQIDSLRRTALGIAGAVLVTAGLIPANGAQAAPTPQPSGTDRTASAAPKAGATVTPQAPATASRKAAPKASGQLTEDFNGAAGSAPSSAVWGYDTGHGFEGWGNYEKQFYTDTRNNSWLDGNGNLVIQAKYDANAAEQWTSARLVTRGLFDFTHGRAEARIKVPQGAGMWPAFWALGTQGDWPNSGEVDIFEGTSWRADHALSNVFGGNAYNDLRMIDQWTNQGAPLREDFHTFAVEKTSDTMQFFVDGKLHHEVTRANMGADWRFDKPVYLLLNVAVGGNFGGETNADSSTDATMLVDYVHVTAPQGTVATGPLAISRAWTAKGGLASRLGNTPRDAPRTRCDLRASGCVQAFDGGLGYWSPSSGAHFVWGEIGKKYADLGWESSKLGYPTSDEFCGLKDGGCGQRFQGGYLYWSPKTGTHAVWGEIARAYANVGWETGKLGYPTSPEFCGLKDGGCAQRFQGGLIYWTPKTGAHAVWGRIGDKYADVRWETSTLGYPTSGEFCGLRDGGCGQRFQGGYIYWTPATDAHFVWGEIARQYAQQGWETGTLRYPVTDELVTATGWEQRFQGGTLTWRR